MKNIQNCVKNLKPSAECQYAIKEVPFFKNKESESSETEGKLYNFTPLSQSPHKRQRDVHIAYRSAGHPTATNGTASVSADGK